MLQEGAQGEQCGEVRGGGPLARRSRAYFKPLQQPASVKRYGDWLFRYVRFLHRVAADPHLHVSGTSLKSGGVPFILAPSILTTGPTPAVCIYTPVLSHHGFQKHWPSAHFKLTKPTNLSNGWPPFPL